MVMRHAVLRYASPEHRFRGEVRVREVGDHVHVPLHGIAELLLNERYSAEAASQRRVEVVGRQVALDSEPLVSAVVKEKDGRRPHDAETVEPRRVCFDVRPDRNECAVNEVSGLSIGIRLGFQPNTGASSGSGAEIQQKRSTLLICVCE
jgi:hypothetical protein